jgi:hypothetical protein
MVFSNVDTPASKAEADELRRQIMQLPEGAQAKIYNDLYNAGHRITHAPQKGEEWYRKLT